MVIKITIQLKLVKTLYFRLLELKLIILFVNLFKEVLI